MDYEQLTQSLVTAIKARDIGVAFTHWTALSTPAQRPADTPAGAPGSFTSWLINHGDYDIAVGTRLA